MYATSYKINNSYTTYVIHDYEEDYGSYFQYKKPIKPLEWKRGAKVKHSLHGKGKISDITKNRITVSFSNSRAFRKAKNITVTYEFREKPSEIDSLCLCY